MRSISCKLNLLAGVIVAMLMQAPALRADEVSFNYRLPQVGDRSSSASQYDFDLNVVLEQAGKVVSSKQQVKLRSVERQVTVMRVAGDRALQVRVNYTKAGERTDTDRQPGEPHSLPIEGKTYVVERRGTASPLVVTDADGNPVSEAEKALVAGNMDSIGHRNQLGRFLHGKSVRVGETLQLPKELAAELLGMREANGDAQRLDLTLTGTEAEPGRTIADFAAVLVVKMGASSTLDLAGTLHIDIDTCRIVAADFAGSISSRDAQADHGEVVEVVTSGTLKVAVKTGLIR